MHAHGVFSFPGATYQSIFLNKENASPRINSGASIKGFSLNLAVNS